MSDTQYRQTTPGNKERYRAYEAAYRFAELLHDWMYERWRNDPNLYNRGLRPWMDSRYGIISESVI